MRRRWPKGPGVALIAAGCGVHGRSARAAVGNSSTDIRAAPTSAADVAGVSRPRLVPTSATTTGNVSVVAWRRPAAAAGLPPSLCRYMNAGTALTNRMLATIAGIRASDVALANSDLTSNCTPVTMKKTGTRNPKPIAWSLPW